MESRYYKLQDAADRKRWAELEYGLPFHDAFRSGGRIDMTIIFPYEPMGPNCPKCRTPEDPYVEPSKIEW